MANYAWKRFWCPRDGAYSLADNGYLSDPELRIRELLQSATCSFDRIRVLSLPGDAVSRGSVKSSEFDSELRRVELHSAGDGRQDNRH